ncbi:MAG: hypothetical protein WC523_03850 [Patescibacteria group bacterium]
MFDNVWNAVQWISFAVMFAITISSWFIMPIIISNYLGWGHAGVFLILILTLIGLYKAQKIKDDLGGNDDSKN